MRRKLILSMLLLTAATTTIGSNEAGATSVQVAAPGFNFSLNDYQPPPPNVYVYENAGRPYYVERDRRVYMQKKHHGHKKYKKHHRDNGRGNGHNKH